MRNTKGTKCTHCGKMFHTCPSCGLVGAEWDYCSFSCYEEAGSPIHDANGDEYDGFPFIGSARASSGRSRAGRAGKLLKATPIVKKYVGTKKDDE